MSAAAVSHDRSLAGWHLLVALQVALFLALAGWVALRVQAWLDTVVAEIRITGALEQTDARELHRRILGYSGLRYADLPLEEIRRQLEADPWIDQVSLYRRWRQVLEVQITENRAVARWESDGLVSERGRVFRPASIAGFEALPRLAGPESRATEVMQQYRMLSRMLRPLGLKVHELKLEPRGAWSARLDNGVLLQIGRERLLERVRRFVEVFAGQLSDYADRIEVVDVRYPNGLAVRWKNPPDRDGQSDR